MRDWLVHAVAALAVFGVVDSRAAAAPSRCSGAPTCCPEDIASRLPQPVQVTVGIVLTGLYNVNEKGGTWDAGYYLYEKWKPTPNFYPQTEVTNEVTRQAE